MKKLFTGVLSTAMIASLAITGCSSNQETTPSPNDGKTEEKAAEKKESVIRMNIQTEPPSLHPGIATDTQSITVIRATMEGLMRIGMDGKPHEAAAEKVEISEDLKTYTFTIRDHKWSNGEAVTAHDFEYAWKWILTPTNEAPYANLLYLIENAEAAKKGEASLDDVGVKALDEKTLQVTLNNPTPYFLEFTAFSVFYPMNKAVNEGNTNWHAEANTHVGNGPYKLAEWAHGSELVLKKSDTYWDAASVKGDTVKLMVIEDQNTEVSMFEAGELDWAGSPLSEIPPDALVPLLQEGKVTSQPIAGTYLYRFNTTKEPFTNAKIRKAFSYAIDRQSLVENVAQGGQMPAMAWVPPTMIPENEKGLFQDNNVEEAKKLLEEGLKELGKDSLPPIELLYNTQELNTKLAQAIQDQWRANLGVEVTLVNKERKVQLEEEKAGQYMMSRGAWLGDINDPVNFLELFVAVEGNNRTYWTNPEFTKLINDTYAMNDNNARMENFKKAEKILMDEMPFMPIYFYTYNYMKADNLKDVYMDGLGSLDLKWAYME
ncbi:peptide ABC transporter substrate-binding protein [Ammoniphilus sp. CFH 90114]|uniref:peptide ABC transporter substrate-binding protein n=1 Tax=Ammoniphilus sp. CFH 90114 TaxID=2493665 RepID=UPI00100F1B58|nr:peptide ABC transporter substrate-binding protein [Ammoniphilus sp. CFH 90114]RXT13731.1 peptide ABC transporter substrate-binding protein [Ammoniphilus sp. CFH 90114]